jgi:hypothetical protein
MKYVNKTIFLQYLICPTLSWKISRHLVRTCCSNKFVAFEKYKVIQMLCNSYQNIINLENTSKHDVLKIFKIKNIAYTLCNISVVADIYKARVDILKKQSNSEWHLFVIKLSTKHKVKHINDTSFIAMVLSKAGIIVSKTTILYISKNYRLGMSISKLFNPIDCTEAVAVQSKKFLNISNKILMDIISNNMPKPYLTSVCKHCHIFNDCVGKNVNRHIFNIPRFSSVELDKLIKCGIQIVDDIPSNFKLTDLQQRVQNCILTNTNYVSKNLKYELDKLQPPFFYLDFESISTAIPLYKHVAPNTQIITQFSLDKTDSCGNILKHYEYIAQTNKDCRHHIAKMLIKYLQSNISCGSIITYANFETMYIKKLMELFPDLNYDLKDILNRIIDLELIIQRNYYNINFHGKSSIKKIISVTNPDFTYSNLDIKNGQEAAVAYALLSSKVYNKKMRKQVKENLLIYCARDTLSMIKIHQFFINLVKDTFK